MRLAGNKAVVTGGAGFVGSHLTEMLLAAGNEVVVIDDFSTGRPQNLEGLASGRLRVVRADVSDAGAIAGLFDGAVAVFHLAALADIVPSIQRPMDYYRANVLGTACVVEEARNAGVGKLVYAASSSCYGIPDSTPTREDAEARPQYPYALTKYLGEQTVLHWGQVYGLPVVALRLFNVYGPRSRTSGTYGAVFGVFLAQKLAQQPFTVVGDGTQSRDFVFVRDVARAFVMAAESDVSGVAMNVGNSDPKSVNRLVELLGGEVVHVPKRPGEPDVTWADTTRIRETLGWVPEVSLEDGVAEMLRNIEYWREAPVWTPESIEVATADWFEHLSADGGEGA
ncbi:MAG: NAD-dependent epimerase/dehydratase family protein [Actinobacteria bacterium]|nr:MAG: NAD-dependent epimerase/dehydratase family protein [Actinomycetota bacterium]